MVIVAGRTGYFYCVSVQEGSGPCEVGESVGLKRNSAISFAMNHAPEGKDVSYSDTMRLLDLTGAAYGRRIRGRLTTNRTAPKAGLLTLENGPKSGTSVRRLYPPHEVELPFRTEY